MRRNQKRHTSLGHNSFINSFLGDITKHAPTFPRTVKEDSNTRNKMIYLKNGYLATLLYGSGNPEKVPAGTGTFLEKLRKSSGLMNGREPRTNTVSPMHLRMHREHE